MQDHQHRTPEQSQNEDAPFAITRGKTSSRAGIGKSIGGAVVLLAWDVGLSGSFLMSLLFCPIWFVVSVLKNAIQRPGWRVALLRTALPALTLGLVLANNAVQIRIAEANAPRIIAACEEFHAANGEYPKSPEELVPQYLPSVPRAKYCLTWGVAFIPIPVHRTIPALLVSKQRHLQHQLRWVRFPSTSRIARQ